MKTKVTVLGQEPKESELKPIEFVEKIDGLGGIVNTKDKPDIFKHIILLCLNYKGTNFDLFFAYNDYRDKGCLFLGHFNDGII